MTQPHDGESSWAAIAWWLGRVNEREAEPDEPEVQVVPPTATGYSSEGGAGSWEGLQWRLSEALEEGEELPNALIVSGGPCAPMPPWQIDVFRAVEDDEPAMQRHVCPDPAAAESYPLTVPFLTHEELVDRFMTFLDEQFCSLYGRAYDIYSESGRRECAEFLARSTEGALAL